MALKRINFKTKQDLIDHIKGHEPTFYYSSQTSTVIPYDKLSEIFKDESFFLGDLSNLPSSMKLNDQGNLLVTGPVNWKDAKQFLKTHKKNIMTAPTEDLALISAGAATSATGERCFHFGNLRSQIVSMKYIDYNGEEKQLFSNKPFHIKVDGLDEYSKEFNNYLDLKNAPFPRFEKETDLLIGTEGQIGVITEIEIKACDDIAVNHLFMLIPKWEHSPKVHIEVLKKIQKFRKNIILCELIDSNSFNYLPKEERPNKEQDAIFFELKSDFFENFYEEFLLDLSFLDEENVFELTESKFHSIRASIPRAVFEENSKMGVVKMGTDVQVHIQDFEKLLMIYKDFAGQGVNYNLFGHFGDAHLHFNFMPSKEQIPLCNQKLEELYKAVVKIKGSPFAEHGIGIIKQKYIKDFWPDIIYSTFNSIKQVVDPKKQFFPQGYMSLKK